MNILNIYSLHKIKFFNCIIKSINVFCKTKQKYCIEFTITEEFY